MRRRAFAPQLKRDPLGCRTVKITDTRAKSRWVVVTLAATRLAAVYGAGVLLLATPLIALFRGLLPPLTIPVAALLGFVVGFVGLAVARRLGFGILWSLLLVGWIGAVRDGIYQVNGNLLFWTVFAVPLYVITAIGLTSRSSRGQRLDVLLTLTAWAVVVTLALTGDIYIHATPKLPPTWANYVCAAWPFAVAGRELARVLLGFRTRIQKEAAA